jgi:hypothetical protein
MTGPSEQEELEIKFLTIEVQDARAGKEAPRKNRRGLPNRIVRLKSALTREMAFVRKALELVVAVIASRGGHLRCDAGEVLVRLCREFSKLGPAGPSGGGPSRPV